MSARFDLSLYLVTDPVMTARRGLLETVAAAVAGGVTIVQLRDKHGPTGRLVEAGRSLRELLRPRGIPLLINDDVEAARAAGADGVHLGQTDSSPAAARQLLGPEAIIGLSLDRAEQLATLAPEVDYVGIGPLFPTGTKADAAPALGEVRFAELRRQVPLPVVAIGGISFDNVAHAIAAGADGIAVVSAICSAADPRAAALALRTAVEKARAGAKPALAGRR